MGPKEKEISLLTFWQVFRRFFWWILFAFVVGVVIAVLYTQFLATPKYSSNATFMVESSTESASVISSSYQTGLEAKAANVITIVTGNRFLQEVADRYNAEYGTTFTPAQLAGRINVTAVSGTAAFRVKVSAATADEAYNLLQVCEAKVLDWFSMNGDWFGFSDETGNTETGDKPSGQQSFIVKEISYGNKSTSPDSPRLVLNVAIGGFGLMLVVYLVFFFVTLFDKTVYGENTIKEQFDTPVLGEIPEWHQPGQTRKDAVRERRAVKKEMLGKKEGGARNYKDRLLSDKTSFSVAEAFKSLRTNLVYTSVGDSTPVFGVLSAFSGVGKSLLVANCAISFTQLGKKVLLIDADMRSPAQREIFEKEAGRPGLSEYLAGLTDHPLDSLTQDTAYPGLDLVTSGRIPPNPGELLASERMEALLAVAKEKYDYIFLDLPPVCATSDAGVLARCVTGYLMVARYAYSNLQAISDSVEAIRAVNGKIIGFIVNDLPSQIGSYGGYSGRYGKYSKYGKYGRYDKSGKETSASSNPEV